MNQFDEAYFDAGINRVGTHCAKWDEMRRETGDPDMIPMWVADMDFESPPAVQEALRRVAGQGEHAHLRAGPLHRPGRAPFVGEVRVMITDA